MNKLLQSSQDTGKQRKIPLVLTTDKEDLDDTGLVKTFTAPTLLNRWGRDVMLGTENKLGQNVAPSQLF